MGYDIEELIEKAGGEVGYLEKATNAYLEDKTKNAGKNNFTKYGLAQGCNSQAWCDAFVDWCFIKTYGRVAAEKLLCGFSNYTPTSAQYFKTKGLFCTLKPQKGDIIFFKNSLRICHTGIVYRVDSTRVYTIEGNTSAGTQVVPNGGAVCQKSYLLTNPRIAGYGRPNYREELYPTIRKGCIGPIVKTLQAYLKKQGFNPEIVIDGDFGEITKIAVLQAQAYYGLTKDGIVGPLTWAQLRQHTT